MSDNDPGVVTRFVASPNCLLNVGDARLALLNYLYALRGKCSYLWRMEDRLMPFYPWPSHPIRVPLGWLGRGSGTRRAR